MPDSNPSLEWYEANASAYADRTHDTDLTHIYERFLAHVPEGGRILDAACGSGRDTLALRARGYVVEAFDGAAAMVAVATANTGQPVRHLRFADVDYESEFDGVWACASLLHLRRPALPEAVARLTRALRPGGVLFMDFKHGEGERFSVGRWKLLFDPEGVGDFLNTQPGLELIDAWITHDTRPGRTDEEWCNALARRVS